MSMHSCSPACEVDDALHDFIKYGDHHRGEAWDPDRSELVHELNAAAGRYLALAVRVASMPRVTYRGEDW